MEKRITNLSQHGGVFKCIYIDPPWKYGDQKCHGGTDPHYKTTTLDEIAGLGIPKLAHPDGALLWMWTTYPMNREGAPHKLLDAWGFRWVGEISWLKPGMGVGRWLRLSTELLILAERGSHCGDLLVHNQRGHILDKEAPVVGTKKRLGHSVKPEQFYKIIENLCEGPRLEMFARNSRPGWYRWGDQAPE